MKLFSRLINNTSIFFFLIQAFLVLTLYGSNYLSYLLAKNPFFYLPMFYLGLFVIISIILILSFVYWIQDPIVCLIWLFLILFILLLKSDFYQTLEIRTFFLHYLKSYKLILVPLFAICGTAVILFLFYKFFHADEAENEEFFYCFLNQIKLIICLFLLVSLCFLFKSLLLMYYIIKETVAQGAKLWSSGLK